MRKKRRYPKLTEFIPRNVKKYVGTWPIVIRSKWERKFCRIIDTNPDIIEWSSEDVVIKYLDPSKLNKVRRYYPDFWFKTKDLKQFIVEIKPLRETRPPRASKKKSRLTILNEQKTFKTNMAKFEAAKRWCDKMNMTFKIITEKELYGSKK